MKKTSVICFVIALISLSSCKKDYTCTCEKKVTATGSALPTTMSNTSQYRRKSAMERCAADGSNFGAPAGDTWTCTLK